MTKEELTAKISALAPLIITFFGLINGILTLRGMPNIQIGDEVITTVVNGLATIIGSLWGWWRNNNWTKKAQEAQPVLNGLKKGTITTQEVRDLVEYSESSKDQN